MRRKNKTSKQKDVIDRIVREIRNPKLREQMINNVTDLSLRDTGMIYKNIEFGDQKKLTKKRKVDLDWTNHAEYRSELRDVDTDGMNQMVTDKLRTKFLKNPRDKGKVKFKGPDGVAVVDYNLSRNPAEADIVTTWASEIVKVAKLIEE